MGEYIYNEDDGKIITGTTEADTIENYGANVSINADKGDDTIWNWNRGDEDGNITSSPDGTTINGGAGNDDITNDGADVSISGGSGNDTVTNWAANVTIDGGKGNDSINNSNENVLFVYRGGNDIIEGFNESSTLKISSGTLDTLATLSGEDIFLSVGKNVITLGGAAWMENFNVVNSKGKAVTLGYKITGTNGADDIGNNRAGTIIDALAGNDTVTNYAANGTIDGGKGKDLLISWSDGETSVNGGAGNDSIELGGANVTAAGGGKGNDSLDNRTDGANSLLDAGAGNDELYNEAAGATLAGGTGDNTLRNNGGENVLFRHSGGNDIIEGFNDSSTLQIASGNFNKIIETDGINLYLTVGEKVITLEGAAELEKINLVNTKGKTVSYSLAPATLTGTDDDDYFEVYVDGAAVSAGKGNDYIRNDGGKNVSLVGGAGNDQIYNQARGDWNEETAEWEIVSSPDNATISAGAGDDYIANEGANVLFRYTGGDDTINGFNETSTLQIHSGKLNSVTSDGDHLFLSVDDNFITLYGAAQLETINVVNSMGRPIAFTVEDVNIVDNEKNSVTLTGTDDRDKIINSGEKVLVNALGGDDTLTNLGVDSTLDAGTGNDYVDNIADGSTFDLGAGKDTVWNEGSNVSIAGGKGDDYISNSSGNGVTLNAGTGNDFIQNSGGSNVSINAGAGDDSVDNESSLATIAGGAGNDYIFNVGDGVIISGGSGDDEIDNEGTGVKISAGAGDDTLWGNASGDTLTGGDGDDLFIIRPGEGKTYITDFASNDLLQILDADGGDGSFTNSSYKNSKLTLALDGGGHVVFQNVSADTSFNINGTSYSISGSKLK